MAVAPLRKKAETIKGGEIISRMLAAEGVSKVFGIIDGTYFGMYSTFADNDIALVTPRHETSAAHMAGAYARLTGGLGVCIASNGPGVANILPGVAVEQAEGNRVLLITSSRRQPIVYPDRGGTFQYFPQVDVIGPMAKFSCHIPSADRIAEVLRRAFRMAYTGRPGVVHIEVPESVMNGTFDLDPSWLRSGPDSYRMTEPLTPTRSQVVRAARMLREAKIPMLHVGSGVVHAQASAQVHTLAELLEAPITTSWAARAALDERRRQVIPMMAIGAVNQTRKEADCVLVLGSRVGETDWWGKAPYWAQPADQKWIQVDIDPETIGVNRPVDLAVQADVKVFLDLVIRELRSAGVSVDKPKSRRQRQLNKLQKAVSARRAKLNKRIDRASMPVKSAVVPVICQEVFDDDAVLVIDGGNTAIWSNFFHEVRCPNTIITTPKMGMLGAGCSQTVAAKVARPDKQVYCIIGDGAMGFHPQEIETAVRNDLPIIYLVLCDKQWGMVKINQQFALKPIKTLIKKTLSPEETINADLGEIAWDRLARSMGAYGERVADAHGLKGAIERALASKKCAVIHVDVDPVDHMWAPNLKTFQDMHGEPAGR